RRSRRASTTSSPETVGIRAPATRLSHADTALLHCPWHRAALRRRNRPCERVALSIRVPPVGHGPFRGRGLRRMSRVEAKQSLFGRVLLSPSRWTKLALLLVC